MNGLKIMIEQEWTSYGRKYLRHPKNRDLITGRVNIINKRNVISISIGKNICKDIGFNKRDRIIVYLNKDNKNLILLEKSDDYSTYSLHDTDKKNSNFLRCTFRYDFHEAFRLTQTIVLDYESNDENVLSINIEKLKWRK